MWGIPQATVIQNSYFDWLKARLEPTIKGERDYSRVQIYKNIPLVVSFSPENLLHPQFL